MPAEVITITILFSVVIWIAVSREAVKSSEKIKWKKMMPVCRNSINVIYNHFTFSKPSVLPLTGVLMEYEKDLIPKIRLCTFIRFVV